MQEQIKQYWKLIVGVLLVVLALLAFTRNVVFVNVQDAFVNAPLSTVRSPIEGQIRQSLPAPGERTGSERPIEIHNERPDQTLAIEIAERLSDVTSRLAFNRERSERLGASIDQFDDWSVRFREARDRYLAERLREAQAQSAAAARTLADAEDNLKRLTGLREHTSPRILNAAQTAVDVARGQLQASRSRERQFREERKALAERIQVTETFSERTFSDQKVQETQLERDLALADIAALEQQQVTLQNGLEAAQAQIERERRWQATLPDAVVWTRVPAGIQVTRGGALGEIAPCDDAVITVTLDRAAFRKIQVGMQARAELRLADGERRRFEATVVSLTGGSLQNVLGMAIPFGRAIVEDAYGAVLRVADSTVLECAIGRPVTLRFSR
jgi:hypothetical protein